MPNEYKGTCREEIEKDRRKLKKTYKRIEEDQIGINEATNLISILESSGTSDVNVLTSSTSRNICGKKN